MSFDENPADDRYELDQCIAEIKRLQAALADAERKIESLQDRNRKSDDQFCELAKWHDERFGVSTGSLIGERSGEYTLVGVVMQTVDKRLADAERRAADAEQKLADIQEDGWDRYDNKP